MNPISSTEIYTNTNTERNVQKANTMDILTPDTIRPTSSHSNYLTGALNSKDLKVHSLTENPPDFAKAPYQVEPIDHHSSSNLFSDSSKPHLQLSLHQPLAKQQAGSQSSHQPQGGPGTRANQTQKYQLHPNSPFFNQIQFDHPKKYQLILHPVDKSESRLDNIPAFPQHSSNGTSLSYYPVPTTTAVQLQDKLKASKHLHPELKFSPGVEHRPIRCIIYPPFETSLTINLEKLHQKLQTIVAAVEHAAVHQRPVDIVRLDHDMKIMQQDWYHLRDSVLLGKQEQESSISNHKLLTPTESLASSFPNKSQSQPQIQPQIQYQIQSQVQPQIHHQIQPQVHNQIQSQIQPQVHHQIHHQQNLGNPESNLQDFDGKKYGQPQSFGATFMTQPSKLKQGQHHTPKSSSKDRYRKRLNAVCQMCGATDTPEWRSGPDGSTS
eukprot:TRINITY_DN3533_c0_g2_i1.p1 TRINITY_DN3533_c0_g2~~TRINITY_DN3533_c0_g2_i1.p1  ORF type:complete len:437 (+),score=71.23 TRINITY_DN3533_c0_g2_i1:212-1522(+)